MVRSVKVPMVDGKHLLYALIVACELGFWIILLLALATRYLLRRESWSRALFIALPLVDVLLLSFTALDLREGTLPTFAHGLAAAYLGFTVAFGGLAVRWADAHFAYRFAGGRKPGRDPLRGWPLVRHELILWGRCIVACVITMVLIQVLAEFVGNKDAVQSLLVWQRHAFGCILLWFLFGVAWSLMTAWRHSA